MRALKNIGMPMDKDVVDSFFKIAHENERVAVQQEAEKRTIPTFRTSAFRSVRCVSEARSASAEILGATADPPSSLMESTLTPEQASVLSQSECEPPPTPLP